MARRTTPTIDERDRHVSPLEVENHVPLSALANDNDLVENDDGSVDILAPEAERLDTEFMDNLAEVFDESDLAIMALDLADLIERDKEARSRRDEQYAEGIRRTGLGNEAPGGAQFEGASKAVHPVLAEGCIDFAARAMKELFPASGPTKISIIGKQTPEKLEKADRKREYMNWQLTTQIKEYRAQLEQLLTQLPLGGSQYLKIWHDDRFNRPRTEFIPIDDLFLPYSASSFDTSHRVTHRQLITRNTFEERIDSGLYREIRNISAPTNPNDEQSASGKASDKIEGRDDDLAYNEDGLRAVLEAYVEYSFEEDSFSSGKTAPYIITLDESSNEVLAVYRNWEEDDETREHLDWIVDWNFIPWRGVYAIGLPHIIGSLAGSLTGALRALLDSAHINNAASMMKLKGARTSGQNISPEIGEVTEIEGPAGIDDIRKLAMPIPYNPPSPVLFQIMDWLVGQAKGVVQTAEESIADASDQMPMGTALAMIEQGSKVFSAIHARMHESQMKVLRILHRINGVYLEDETTIDELGELIVKRTDFLGPMDVIPVSDPNIFSEAQRYAQLQAVMQLSQQFPQLYKADKLNKRALALLNFPGADEILNTPDEPERIDPVSENVCVARGDKPIKAFEEQDHIGHIAVHTAFLSSPVLCQNPMMAQPALPALLAHIKEHLLFQYEKHAKAAVQAAVAMQKETGDPEAIPRALALEDQALAQQLAEFLPHITAAAQAQSKLCPPPPPNDPNAAVALQVGMAQVNQKSQSDQAKLQQEQDQWKMEQAKLQEQQAAEEADDQRQAQMQQANDERDAQRQAAQDQAENTRAEMLQQFKLIGDLLRNENDNHTKVLVADIAATKQALDDTASQQNDQIQQLVSMIQGQAEQHQQLIQSIPQMLQQKLAEQQPPPGMLQRLFGGGQQPQAASAMPDGTAQPPPVTMATGQPDLVSVLQGIHEHLQQQNTPKRIVRDANGNIAEIHPITNNGAKNV